MQITEVRIKLVAAKNDKLRAFCSITIDDAFVVRDLKVIEGAKGPFVAMPSRKVMERCMRCGEKNHHRANFCNECGQRLAVQRGKGIVNRAGAKLHADIAHPINSSCREVIQVRILERYAEELEKARLPGYRPQEIDDDYYDGPCAAEYAHDGELGTYPESFIAPASPVEGNGAPLAAPHFFHGVERSDERSDSAGAARDGVGAYSPGQRPPPRSGMQRLDAEHPGHKLKAKPPTTAGSRHEFDAEPEDNFGAGLFS